MGSIQIPDEIIALLSDIWHHLGLDEDQRKQALDGLRASLSDFVLKFVEQEQHRVEDAKQNIANVQQRISLISKALGEADRENAEIDGTTALLQQLQLLQNQEAIILQRKVAITDVMNRKLNELQNVYRQLDMGIPEEFAEVGDADLTDSRLCYIDAALDQARQERNSRQAKMAKLLSAANSIAKQLEESPVKNAGITPDDLLAVEKKLHELQKLVSEKSQKLEELRALVEKRWTDLQKSNEHTSMFRNSLVGFISTDVRLFENELDRLNRQYAAALPRLVEAGRERVQGLRAELRFHAADVEIPHSNESMEEELHALEKEERTLKAQLEGMRPILQQISKWEMLRLELQEGLAEASAYANDPNRFHGRQAFKMLKKEEDLRRLESKTLPRMQEKLQVAILNYEREQGGQPLLIDGKPFLLTLKEFCNNGKENCLRTPNASPAVARTPNTANQTPGLVRRMSSTSVNKKVASTPDSLPRPRRLRISAAAEGGRSSPSMQDRLAKVLEQADSALKSTKGSEEVLFSLSQAIDDLNGADTATRMKHADALSDLYHKRAVIYTHIGDYDASIRDSEAAQVALSWGRNVIS